MQRRKKADREVDKACESKAASLSRKRSLEERNGRRKKRILERGRSKRAKRS